MRIYYNHAHICYMKTRLNLTIDEEVLHKMKYFAQKNHTSVSELVEEYFKTVTKPKQGKSFMDLVAELPKPKIDDNIDLKAMYYEDKAKKYGL